MSDVLVHDDDCDEVLADGHCPRCRFAPDAQSVARVDVRGLLREMPTLRLRLAAVERERDEAWRAVNDPTIARLHTLRDEMLTATVEALGAVKAERDAAIQRAATAEADTVARIVSMIRAKVQHLASLRPYDEYRSGGADSLDVLADDIEAGAWRGKEGA